MNTRLALLFVLVFFGSLVAAEAQERVIPLRKGGTIWSILQNEGCAHNQIAVLWPLVVKDSGLDPQNERTFPVGTLIFLKRRCDGQPSEISILRARNEELKKTSDSLTEQLNRADARVGDLAKRVGELEQKIASIQKSPPGISWLNSFFFLFGGALTAVIGFLFLSRNGSSFRSVRGQDEDDLVFPSKVVEEHNGEAVVFERHYDRITHRIGMRCPFCRQLVESVNVREHLRREHRTEGVFTWEVNPDLPEPDLSSLDE